MGKKFEEVAPVIPDEHEEVQGSAGADGRPAHVDEETWLSLSDAEREGLRTTDDELDDKTPGGGLFEDEETLKKIAGDTAEEKPGVKPAEKPAEAAAPATDGELPAGEVEVSGEILADEDLLKFRPTVSDSELKISDEVPAEIAAKLSDLDDKFDNNEISLRDYNKERDALNRQVTIASINQRDEAKQDLVWEKEQQFFLSARPEYLGEKQADGSFKGSIKADALFGALNKTVEAMNNDPKNATKTGIEILIEADNAVREAFNLPKYKKGAAPAAAPAKPGTPRPDMQTLANAPAAAAEMVDTFAALDNLTGEAYERALESLPPAAKEKYLSMA